MRFTTTAPPAVYLAGDIGTSASKLFYRVSTGQTVPLWMGAEVAQGLTTDAIPSVGSREHPQSGAWLQVGDEVILVGESAKAFLDANSLTANKSEKAAYKLLAMLGVIAERENIPSAYEATIWVPLPLTEIRTREAIATKLNAIAQSGFIFRDHFQRVNLSLKFFPEGFGLYLNRKKQLAATGMAIENRRTLILMMGHRNLSILCFESGSLKAAASNSDGPGFWSAFEKGARSLGVTPADYSALLAALTTGKTQQISQVRAGLYDFGTFADSIRQTYWQQVSIYLQDHLLSQLSEPNVDIIISGGAAHVVRSLIRSYFENLGIRASFADEQQPHLSEMVRGLLGSASDAAILLRMMDGYGLFQGLIGKLSKPSFLL
jgi:hypothetical protein